MDEIIDEIYGKLLETLLGGIIWNLLAVGSIIGGIAILIDDKSNFIVTIILFSVSLYIIILSPKELGDVIRDMKAIKNGEYEVIVGKIVGVKEAGENTETRIKWYDSIVMDSESGEQVELWLIGHNDEDNKISKTEKEYTFYYVKNTKVAYCPELKNYK